MFVPSKLFQPSLMIVGKARSLPKSGAPESYFTWIDSSLTLAITRDEHFSLYRKFVSYGRKKMYNIGLR